MPKPQQEAERYDRRWAAYLRGSMALLRPWLGEAPLGRVLDVGCGTGVLVRSLDEWGLYTDRYVGVDPSWEMLSVMGEAERVCAPAEALPFRDASFDTIVSASAFHYWPEPREGLREVARVLAPGGRVLIADWARDFPTMRVMNAVTRLKGYSFERTYAEREIHALLEDAGLRVVRSRRAKITPMWGLWVVEARGG